MIGFAQRCRAAGATAILVAISTGCAGETSAAACAQGALFDAARQRVERAVSDLSDTTSLELQESVVAISDQVAVMREVSPRSLRGPLGVLLAAYGQLVVSLDDVGFDPKAAETSTNVANARTAFTDRSVAGALAEVEDFLSTQCELARSAANPGFAISGTTLPLPDISEEPSRDVIEDGAVSDTELQAFGFSIGETYGVALSAPEAQCLGQRLSNAFGATGDIDVNDTEYFEFIQRIFVECEIGTPPTTTLPK